MRKPTKQVYRATFTSNILSEFPRTETRNFKDPNPELAVGYEISFRPRDRWDPSDRPMAGTYRCGKIKEYEEPRLFGLLGKKYVTHYYFDFDRYVGGLLTAMDGWIP